MSRWVPFPLMSGALALGWLALAGASAAHIVLAVFFAVAIPRMVAPFLEGLPRARAPLRALQLAAHFTWDVVVANVAVARLVLGSMERPRPTFVEVPLELEHPHAIAFLATIITMTPGTVSAAVSADRRVLYVHVLATEDASGLVARIKARYEQPLLEILGC